MERIHEDRARSVRRRRSVAIFAAGLVVLVLAVLVTRRPAETPVVSNPPSPVAGEPETPRREAERAERVETPAPTAATADPPATARPIERAPAEERAAAATPPERRPERREALARIPTRERVEDPRELPSRELPSRDLPSRSPTTPGSSPSPPSASPSATAPTWPSAPPPPPTAAPAPSRAQDVRVEVAQKPDRTRGTVDYTVRLFGPGGAPVTGADVRLRGITTDGTIVEAPLEPAGQPGVYHALLSFSPRGPRALTLRIARADTVVEVPVAEAAGARAPAAR